MMNTNWLYSHVGCYLRRVFENQSRKSAIVQLASNIQTHRTRSGCKFLLPLTVLFSCLISFLPALAQDKLPEIIKKITPSTVVILTYDKDGKDIGQGSGFFISQKGDVITNKHVLAGANRAEVKTTDGKVYPITLIIAEDKEADIVRVSVKIPLESVRPLSVSSSIPQVGERVAVIGSPLGLERTVSDGIVAAIREIPAFGNIYQITAPISPGSSGSPVINMKGEVIGIVTFQVIEGQNLNFAIPGERITKLKTTKGKTYTQWRTQETKESSDSAKVLYDKGLAFVFVDDCEKALSYLERSVKKDPRNQEAYFYIGFCSSDLRRYTEAIDAYKQAIRIKPDDANAHNNLGKAYAELGRYTEAIDALKQAIRIMPDLAEAHFALGATYWSLKRYTEAIDAYKQTIRIKPDFALAHLTLGSLYVAFERPTEAVDPYKQAIRIKPDYAEAHYWLGVTYGKLGRNAEAIDVLKQAIRIKPDYADAHFALGVIYLLVGDKGPALEQYKILQNLDSNKATELFNVIYNQEEFVLDCPVTGANPLFDAANFPEGKAIILMERYRFLISRGDKTGFATTPRGNNIPIKIIESDTQYQVYFENKRIVIDRTTAEFQVGAAGASGFFGTGICTKIGERKF